MGVLQGQVEAEVLERQGRGETGILEVGVALELEVREPSWSPFLQTLKVY